MNTPQILSTARTLLKVAGGYLAANSELDTQSAELWVGLAVALLGVLWSHKSHDPESKIQ